MWDANADGHLSVVEVRDGANVPRREARAMVRAADRNGDGVISASHVGAFTPCVVSRNAGSGWFLFRF